MLYLIRHAETVKDPSRPAAEWDLRPDAAATLAAWRRWHVWKRIPRWYSSPEPKAVHTAIGLTSAPVIQLAELAEVRREGWTDNYDDTVERLFRAPDTSPAPGWECASQTLARFDRCMRTLATPGTDLAVVTHGLVLSLWRAKLARAPVDLAQWRALRFPDLLTLSDADLRRWLANDDRPVHLRHWAPTPAHPTANGG